MFVWLVALWLYAFPPTQPPPALHVLGLTCCPTPAPLHRESPLAQNPLDGRGLFQNCAVPWDADTPMCLWVPQFLRTPQLITVCGLRSHFGSSHFGSSHFGSRLESLQACSSLASLRLVSRYKGADLPTSPSQPPLLLCLSLAAPECAPDTPVSAGRR
jgi:hypothetical protein